MRTSFLGTRLRRAANIFRTACRVVRRAPAVSGVLGFLGRERTSPVAAGEVARGPFHCGCAVLTLCVARFQVRPVALAFAVLGSVTAQAADVGNSESLTVIEQFKSFISSPPVIEELVYRRKLGKPTRLDGSFEFSTNYAFVQARRQPDAFFYRVAKSTNWDSLKIQGRLAGHVSSNYWSIGSTNGPIFWRTLSTNDVPGSSFVYSMVEEAMYDVSEVLNMGVRHLKIGSIHWDGNHFAAKSEVEGLFIFGRLVAYTNGFPEQLMVSYSNRVNVADYIIRYTYATNLHATGEPRLAGGNGTIEPAAIRSTAFTLQRTDSATVQQPEGRAPEQRFTGHPLPQRIHSYLVIKGREYLLEELVIMTLRTGSQPLSFESFSPEQFVRANNLPARVFAEGAVYAKEPDGRLRLIQKLGQSSPPGFRMNFSRSVKRTIYLISFCFLNLGLLVLLGKVSRRATNTNKQQKVSI